MITINNVQIEEKKLTDLALASALVAVGAKVTDVKKIGYSQAEFTLEGDDLSHELLQFQNRDLQVDAMTLFENHKSLKSRANDVLRNTY